MIMFRKSPPGRGAESGAAPGAAGPDAPCPAGISSGWRIVQPAVAAASQAAPQSAAAVAGFRRAAVICNRSPTEEEVRGDMVAHSSIRRAGPASKAAGEWTADRTSFILIGDGHH